MPSPKKKNRKKEKEKPAKQSPIDNEASQHWKYSKWYIVNDEERGPDEKIAKECYCVNNNNNNNLQLSQVCPL